MHTLTYDTYMYCTTHRTFNSADGVMAAYVALQADSAAASSQRADETDLTSKEPQEAAPEDAETQKVCGLNLWLALCFDGMYSAAAAAGNLKGDEHLKDMQSRLSFAATC